MKVGESLKRSETEPTSNINGNDYTYKLLLTLLLTLTVANENSPVDPSPATGAKVEKRPSTTTYRWITDTSNTPTDKITDRYAMQEKIRQVMTLALKHLVIYALE